MNRLRPLAMLLALAAFSAHATAILVPQINTGQASSALAACKGPDVTYQVTDAQVQVFDTISTAMLMQPEGADKKPLLNLTALASVMDDLGKQGYTQPLPGGNSDDSVFTVSGRKQQLTGEVLYNVLARYGKTSKLMETSQVVPTGAPAPVSLESLGESQRNDPQFRSLITTAGVTGGVKTVDYFMCSHAGDVTRSVQTRITQSPADVILDVQNTRQGILFVLTRIVAE